LLGFFTLVSLALAFVLSGWWWAGFVVMLILWGKQLEAKNPTSIKGKTKELERLVEEYEQADEELSRQLYEDSRQGSSQDAEAEWPAELIDACSSLTAQSYYIGDLIPKKKQAAAMANYPLPGDGELLALIDGTVFGSAAKGLAIGRAGIAWKSGSEKPVKMLWDYLAESQISSGTFKVSVGTSEFDHSGTGIKADQLKDFLLCLQGYARLRRSTSGSVVPGESKADRRSPKRANIPRSIVAVNTAEFDELLALPGIGAAEQAFSSNIELADYLDLKPHITAKLDGLTDFGPATSARSPKAEPPKPSTGQRPKLNTLGGRTID
jgi:hypothetical protein